MLPLSIPNAFTVDVEDYFQVSAFEDRVSRKEWNKYESRVEFNTDRILAVLEKHNVQGTFFILGWVADRFPDLIRRIHVAGHELASHGYWHQLVYNQTPQEFADDLVKSKDAIANASGVFVTSYRAPSFSITQKSIWALEVLAANGFTVDSSIFPIRGHDRYGMPDAKREIHQIETQTGRIVEFPPSAWHLGKVNFPIGGGYFRMFPLSLTLKSMRQVNRSGRPAMFYIHPWELDPSQPRIANIGFKSRFRHYVGLGSTENKLNQLLQLIKFRRMGDLVSEARVGV